MCSQKLSIKVLSVYSQFFLHFWTNDVTYFLKVTQIISLLNCHLRFSIVVLETFKFKKKGLAMWLVSWIESQLCASTFVTSSTVIFLQFNSSILKYILKGHFAGNFATRMTLSGFKAMPHLMRLLSRKIFRNWRQVNIIHQESLFTLDCPTTHTRIHCF